MHIDRLETPALVLDAKILSENIEAMKKILEGSSIFTIPGIAIFYFFIGYFYFF